MLGDAANATAKLDADPGMDFDVIASTEQIDQARVIGAAFVKAGERV